MRAPGPAEHEVQVSPIRRFPPAAVESLALLLFAEQRDRLVVDVDGPDSQANSLRAFYGSTGCNVSKNAGPFVVVTQQLTRTFFVCADGSDTSGTDALA
jgi:hypothetical protein